MDAQQSYKDRPIAERNFEMLLAYSAIELIFIMQYMLECFYVKTEEKDFPYGTHPPSLLRLTVLRNGMVNSSYPPWILDLGKQFEEAANEILSKV